MSPLPAIPGRLRMAFEPQGAEPATPVVPVRVIERLGDDAYRVAVEGRAVSVRLAGNHEPGRVLALAFAEPLPDADPAPTISPAARAVLALSPAPADSPPGAVLEPVVVVVDAPEAASTLAGELAGRIVRSGLFYESHLADWAEGKLPRDAVAREPQSQLSVPKVTVTEVTVTLGTDTLGTDTLGTGAQGTAPVPKPLEPIVREQLATLERHEARFAIPCGQARPAELVVARERGGRDGAEDPEGAWTSRLKLELPNLGEVTARVRLMGRSVSLDFEASDEMTDTLVDDVRSLRKRLAALELNVGRLVISSHG